MAKTKAFSLIEALLVVAIASVLVSLGLSFANKYAQRVKVKRTAFELQQILEAGGQYFTVFSTWPDSSHQDLLKPYLSLSSLKNPWGYAYTYDRSSETKFSVATTFPDSTLELQVEALMPNAYHDRANHIVVEIPVHAITASGNFVNYIGSVTVCPYERREEKECNAYFQSEGTQWSGFNWPVPTCPAGFARKIFPIIRNIELGTLRRNAPFSIGEISIQHNDNDAWFRVNFVGNRFRDAYEGDTYRENFALVGEHLYTFRPLDWDGKFEFYIISYCMKQ